MRRVLAFCAAILAGLALVAVPASAADEPALVHYFGALKSVPAWHVLDDDAHTPQGITSVVCDEDTGYLYVGHTGVAQVGTVLVTADETWAGSRHAGASAGLTVDVVVVRSSSGAVIRCDSAALASASGNLWVDAWGWE